MLKKKALRKILITTFSIFTIFVLCIVPNKLSSNYLNPNIEVEYVNSLATDSIYLYGPNNYLVKTNILLVDGTLDEKIENIISYLTINKNSKLPSSLKGVLSENIIVNSINIDGTEAVIDFSNLFNNRKDEERIVESLTYSITDLDGIKSLKILVDGKAVTELPISKKRIPESITKDFGINKVYDIDSRNGIQKVTLYYIDNINDFDYYVPVTKYINDSREKIDIIIENLSSNYIYDKNLVSFLKSDTELIDYQIEDELMLLNFNNSIFSNEKVLEETSYTLAYSIFDNYNVKTVLFEVNGVEVNKIEKEKND